MPRDLSGGQQQRVAVGRAIVRQPRVFLFDEPLSNLDAKMRAQLRAELIKLHQRLQTTIIYVTHDQAEAMSMADQVVLLNQGRIEQDDAPRALYARPATPFAARFIGTPPMSLLRLDGGCIAGSAVTAGGGAAMLGLRPEDVRLGGPVEAVVQGLEYLGADLVLRCVLGTETLTVRAAGRTDAVAGSRIRLGWDPADEHRFDPIGRRLD
jgi:sn-glycerol 3-phosphate transport system ATP-binding protein